MRCLSIALLCLALTACASKPVVQPPSSTDKANTLLAESARSIDHSLIALDATEQAANPPQSVSSAPDPSTYGMAIPASLVWSGPVEPALREIATAASYKVKVIGTAPAIPVLVYVNEPHSTLGDLLRNIGLQCKNQAQIVLFPRTKTIELRYTSGRS